MNELYELFQSIYPLSNEFWRELRSLVKENAYPKKHLLLREGCVCREIHFLTRGIARAYYLNNGEEITSWIMKEGDVIISVESFYRQTPAYENIEFLEDAQFISLGYDMLRHLYGTYLDFNYVARVITENYYMLSEERSFSLRMQTALKRYEILLAAHPEIFQRVPLKYIASYLGMKPETLSRMRAKVG